MPPYVSLIIEDVDIGQHGCSHITFWKECHLKERTIQEYIVDSNGGNHVDLVILMRIVKKKGFKKSCKPQKDLGLFM